MASQVDKKLSQVQQLKKKSLLRDAISDSDTKFCTIWSHFYGHKGVPRTSNANRR